MANLLPELQQQRQPASLGSVSFDKNHKHGAISSSNNIIDLSLVVLSLKLLLLVAYQ